MLREAFGFELPALVNFVGGGGKTAAILRLAHEYAASSFVLYTTTTRIHPPPPARRRVFLASSQEPLRGRLVEQVARNCSDTVRVLVVTESAISPTLFRGVPAEFAEALDRSLLPLILNEADGARSMSIKMPRPGEPVLMRGGSYLVPVIGLDCLDLPLGPGTLFRWELVAARLGLRLGEPLTAELAAGLLLHPEGVCRDWRPDMRILPFINKVDAPEDEPKALELARALLRSGSFPVDGVVWGSIEREWVGSCSR